MLAHLIILWLITSIARALPSDVAAACDDALRGAVTAKRARELPSPLSVDPENEQEIFAFIGALVPIPAADTVFGLEMVIKKFWALYRPDLTKAEIDARLQPHRPSQSALDAILRERFPRRRIHIGRFRLWWVAFVADVVPDAPPPHPLMIERAEALSLKRNAGIIAKYLNDRHRLPTVNSVPCVARSLARLYARNLPFEIPPPVADRTWTKAESDAEIAERWGEYADLLNEPHEVAVSVYDRTPIVPKYGVDFDGDPAAVPDDVGAMLEYLALRYRYIRPTEPRALTRYLDGLRAELGLPRTAVDLKPMAFKSIWHHRVVEASRILREEWHLILRTRARPPR